MSATKYVMNGPQPSSDNLHSKGEEEASDDIQFQVIDIEEEEEEEEAEEQPNAIKSSQEMEAFGSNKGA